MVDAKVIRWHWTLNVYRPMQIVYGCTTKKINYISKWINKKRNKHVGETTRVIIGPEKELEKYLSRVLCSANFHPREDCEDADDYT